MTGTVSPFDASNSALGYLYQCRYALLLALQKGEDPNLCLSIEKLDDLAFHDQPSSPSLARELLQFKHHINRQGGLGDSSPDIWKTLRIWALAIQAKQINLDHATFCLVTTSQTGNRNAVRYLRPDSATRKPLDALSLLECAGAKSKNTTVIDAYTTFSSLSVSQKQRMFQSLYLLDNASSAIDLEQSLGNAVRYCVHPQHRGAFLERLEGWWLQRIVRHLCDPPQSVISVAMIQQQVHNIREQFRRESLPDDELNSTPPPEATPDEDDRMFLQQLHLIGLSVTRLRYAQQDHYKAFTQRSRWVKEELMGFEEVTNYEARLVDGWQERFTIMAEGIPSGCDESTQAQHGLRLYDWIVTEAPSKCALWVRPNFQAEYMTKGSYHMLADLLRVGWHPEYKPRLDRAERSSEGAHS